MEGNCYRFGAAHYHHRFGSSHALFSLVGILLGEVKDLLLSGIKKKMSQQQQYIGQQQMQAGQMMAGDSPLYLLESISGVRRIVPEEYKFRPSLIPPSINVTPSRIEESVVEDFKKAVGSGNRDEMVELMFQLWTDKALMVKALIESAIWFINAESLGTVSLILEVTKENMDALTVMSVLSLLERTQRSGEYKRFVSIANTDPSPEFNFARSLLSGQTVVDHTFPENYRKLNLCDIYYRAYPSFEQFFPSQQEDVVLPIPTGRAKRQANEMSVLR